jgi:ribosomal-protein-serine acetyltransferase
MAAHGKYISQEGDYSDTPARARARNQLCWKGIMFSWEIGEDLTLRSLGKNDAAALFSLIEANRKYLREYLAWVDDIREVDGSAAFIKLQMENEQSTAFPHALAVFYAENLAGVCGFNSVNFANSYADIGYWLDAPLQGKGIVTRCVKFLIDYAFHQRKLHRIEIRCMEKNYKSRKIIESLGAKYEGTKREVLWLYDHWESERVYSLLTTDKIKFS